MGQQSRTETLLPFILAVALPAFLYLNNSARFALLKPYEFLLYATALSSYLLFLWFTNKWLSDRTHSHFYWKAFLLNSLLALTATALVWEFAPHKLVIEDNFYVNSIFRIFLISIVFIAIQQSLKALKMVEKLSSENLELKTEMYRAELDHLRKQVNPHFLFNSLNVLRMMVRDGHPKTEKFLMNLSLIYRQLLQTSDQSFVTLDQEAKTLESYLFVMQARYQDALHATQEIDKACLHYQCPSFALQLLVENCITHNIVSIKKPLYIKIFHEDDHSISVSNNYQPKNTPTQSNKLGLQNLKNRYDLMGVESGVEVSQTDLNFKVRIKLI